MSAEKPPQGGDPFVVSGPLPRDHPLRLATDRYPPATSRLDAAADKLARCHKGLGLPSEQAADAARLLSEVWGPSADRPIGDPRWRCYISVDGSPFELSASWRGGAAEVRISVEALADPPEPVANQAFGWDYLRGLAGRPGARVEHVLALEDLFRSAAPREHYWMGHGVAWPPGGDPLFKVYLDPHVGGPEHAPAVVGEAMERLGAGKAWRAALAHIDGHGGPGRIGALSLDLVDPERARAKVYLQYPDLDAEAIDRQAGIARGHVPGAFAAALRAILGGFDPPFARPPVTCFAFRKGEARPVSAALYVPMVPPFADDAEARDRVAAFMRGVGVDPGPYASFLESLADRPLDGSRNQNFIAYEPAGPGREPRFSVYAAPGLYA
ncbi:tryptophan dimethylallyltransferase family protein [Actinorugispora endophytica]|nr:tryptophan dimethylallyltransferase family protein [Actinorugispora endophytica]